MAILTADAQLAERRLAVHAVAVRNRLGQAAVAHDAARRNGPAKTVIAELVARRQRPRARLRVIRERRLEEVIALPNDIAHPVRARANRVLDLLSIPEDLASVRPQLILALIEARIAAEHLEVTVELLVVDGDWGGNFFELRGVAGEGHGVCHVGLRELFVDVRVTARADS